MPILGFGVYQISDPRECERSVYDALQTGCGYGPSADIELTTGELQDLNDALAKIEISGYPYPAELAKRVGK